MRQLWMLFIVWLAIVEVGWSRDTNVQNDLLQSAFIADVQRVELLLREDPSILTSRPPVLVDWADAVHGRTAAMVCGFDPQHGDKALLDQQCTAITIMLHEAGANLTRVDFEGWDALSLAAVRGMTKVCDYLLTVAKVPVDTRDNTNRTALMKAAALGHLDVVHLLLTKGANARSSDVKGQTALHLATQLALHTTPTAPGSSFVPFLRQFLSAMKSCGDCIDQRDEDGRTALMYAAIGASPHQEEVVHALLESNADPRLYDNFQVWTPNMARSLPIRGLLLEAVASRAEAEHRRWLES